jgi:nicotinate-nucleotide adenylyltransferase
VRVGILGGTFDPIHIGHLAAAEAAIRCARLDRVLFIPAGTPPHRGPAVATARQRLEMCRLAIDGDPRFEVSEVELERTGPAYTLDTLSELRRTRPDDDFWLVLGWDAAAQFSTWHQPRQVLAIAPLLVIPRPGQKAPERRDLEAAGLDPERVTVCHDQTPAVSASELRRAVASGRPIGGQVPPAVERYIAAGGLYASS